MSWRYISSAKYLFFFLFLNYSLVTFLRLFWFYQKFYFKPNHQLVLLLFWIVRFEAVWRSSVADCLALSTGFWVYLLLKFLPIFLPIFLVKDKNSEPFKLNSRHWDYVICTEMRELFSENDFSGNISSLITHVHIGDINISAA